MYLSQYARPGFWDKIDEVVSLLEQGEENKKYKQMWEELYEISSEFNFFPLMDGIKQKYFPKEERLNET